MKKLKLLLMTIAFIAVNLMAQEDQEDQVIEEVTVTGSRAALQNALNRQRDADGVVGVVDSDAIGNFADINVAESLRRLSGIMVENDQGEGRYVSVRGMNTDLNAMTINGASSASPEDRRGILLDGVPTDLLDSMTVYKTLMPNLDADSIGGAIELSTISAFSQNGRRIRFRTESSYNELTEDGSNPKISATYLDQFDLAGGTLGVAFVLSNQERHIVAHNNETGGYGETYPNDDYEMRFYDIIRERDGIVANLDYQSDAGHTAYFRAFTNEYTDTEYRGKWEVRDGMEDNVPTINGNIYTYADSKVDSEARYRVETRQINSYQLGGEFMLSPSTFIEAQYFTSNALQDDTNKYALIFRSDDAYDTLTYDNSDPQQPVVTFNDALYDASVFQTKAFEHELGLTEDEDSGFKIDLTTNLGNTTVQAGIKLRDRVKTNNFNFCGYDFADKTAMSEFDYVTWGNYLNSFHGPAPSVDMIMSYVNQRGTDQVDIGDGTTCIGAGSTVFDGLSGDEAEESIPADWTTEENIFASYVMGTTVIDNATFVYGVRYEDTETTLMGKDVNADFDYQGVLTYEKNYGFAAPSLNIKYELDDTSLVRFAWYRSLVRPGFNESRASLIINVEDNEIEGGNPLLDPITAVNFDVGYEKYFGPESAAGFGFFYKELEDAIYQVQSANLVVIGQTWDQASTYINSGKSTISGFEIFGQTAWDNGLFVAANITLSDSESDLPADSVAGNRAVPYVKNADTTWNITFGYDQGPWDVRFATNYRSAYLDELGDAALYDRYTDDYMTMDLSARYSVNDQLELRGEVININSAPEYYYFGNTSRLSQYDEYGPTVSFGFRYDLVN